MADQKISAMTVATDLISAEVPIIQGGVNKRSPISLFTTGPAGSDTQVQYNNAGAFGATSNYTYDGTYVKITNAGASNISTRYGAGVIYFDNNTGASSFTVSAFPSAFGSSVSFKGGNVNSGNTNGGDAVLQGGDSYTSGNGNGGNAFIVPGTGHGTGKNGNIGIGLSATSFGTSAVNVIALALGTAPTANPGSGLNLWVGAEPEGNSIITRNSSGNISKMVLQKKVTISSAQILTIGTVPVTLIAAPGANKYLNIVSMALSYNYGTTAYDFSTVDLQFELGASNRNYIFLNSLINGVSDVNVNLIPYPSGIGYVSSPTNTGFRVTTSGSVNPTTGDGDLDIVIYYTIEDVNT